MSVYFFRCITFRTALFHTGPSDGRDLDTSTIVYVTTTTLFQSLDLHLLVNFHEYPYISQ